jgi:hypothetical protein
MENVATPAAPQNGFEAMPFPVRSFGPAVSSKYRVYSSPSEHVDVEAETAMQAYAKSGVADPRRIVREIPGQRNLIDREKCLEALKADDAAAAAAPAAGEAAPAAVAEAVPAAEAAKA